jgi:hypothetical protein
MERLRRTNPKVAATLTPETGILFPSYINIRHLVTTLTYHQAITIHKHEKFNIMRSYRGLSRKNGGKSRENNVCSGASGSP